MRGGRNPCAVLLISNFADASGEVVPIPTCARLIVLIKMVAKIKQIDFGLNFIFNSLVSKYIECKPKNQYIFL